MREGKKEKNRGGKMLKVGKFIDFVIDEEVFLLALCWMLLLVCPYVCVCVPSSIMLPLLSVTF